MRRANASFGLALALGAMIATQAAAQQPPAPKKSIQAGLQRVFETPPAPEVPQPPPTPTASPLPTPPAALSKLPGLTYRGGASLTPSQKGFTSYADIVVFLDGGRFNLVEGGNWVSGELRYDAKGDLVTVLPSNSGFLRDEHGKPLKAAADKQAATLDYDNVKLTFDTGSRYLVGFADHGRIVAYKGITAVGRPLALPAEAPLAGGVATLANLPGGGFVTLAADGRGWLSTPKGAGAITLPVAEGWTPRDLTALPGGDLLLIERKATASRISRVAAADVAVGKTLRPVVLATAASPLAGGSARKGPKGETLLYLLADGSPSAIYMFELTGN